MIERLSQDASKLALYTALVSMLINPAQLCLCVLLLIEMFWNAK